LAVARRSENQRGLSAGQELARHPIPDRLAEKVRLHPFCEDRVHRFSGTWPKPFRKCRDERHEQAAIGGGLDLSAFYCPGSWPDTVVGCCGGCAPERQRRAPFAYTVSDREGLPDVHVRA